MIIWLKLNNSGFVMPELEELWKMKPVLDGKVIMKALQIKNGRPQVNQWVRSLLIILQNVVSMVLNKSAFFPQKQRDFEWQLSAALIGLRN